ncbi:MAG: hypothetical protein MI799_09230 [Desulfobacterales bacterium]|nr:hypothetical protein [Desulfobacterales bacterium]
MNISFPPSFSSHALNFQKASGTRSDKAEQAPPLTYEEALKNAVEKLKEEMPPKSIQERAVEGMKESGDEEKATESDNSSNSTSGTDHQDSGGGSGNSGDAIDSYV